MQTSTADTIVLVTGGSGMLGQAIKNFLKKEEKEGRPNEEWIFLSSKDADLRDVAQTQSVFKKHKPTHVIHLAAVVGGVLQNTNSNCDSFLSNSRINQNVLEASQIFGVKKVVSCLSTSIFPDKITYPIDESMLHSGLPHNSNFGFSHAKRAIDVMNKAFAQQYGCLFTSVCCTNVYGPEEDFNAAGGHVIPGLMKKVYEAKKTDTPVVQWGTGTPRRQFIYSSDAAELIIWALKNYEESETMFLTVDEKDEVSIRELTDIIASAFDFKGEIVQDTSKPDGQFKKTASNAKLRRYLPDFRFTPLNEGIKRTVDWFVENYDKSKN